MPVRYILSSVWVELSVFSQLSIIQCMGMCVFSFPISLVMIEKIYTLSYYHHQIGSMNCYPLFRVRSWNNGLRCMSLYILTIIEETGEFPHKGQWRWALMFSLITAWTNSWVNNRNPGDLRPIMTSLLWVISCISLTGALWFHVLSLNLSNQNFEDSVPPAQQRQLTTARMTTLYSQSS